MSSEFCFYFYVACLNKKIWLCDIDCAKGGRNCRSDILETIGSLLQDFVTVSRKIGAGKLDT